MLTAELVRARKKSGELLLRPLAPKEKPRALELAASLLEVARAHVGRSREDLVEAWDEIPVAANETKLADGFRKLIEDDLEFAAVAEVDPAVLRSDVFLAASAARRETTDIARFDRTALVGEVAGRHGLAADVFERALYADLKNEQLVQRAPPPDASLLVERYERGQVQAVLLRAVHVVAEVTCSRPEAYRELFRELKFRRLLHRVELLSSGGYRIFIDGPFSLFDSVTKYGLELALVLPALERCDSLVLAAEVKWGKDRTTLKFRHATHRTDVARAKEAALPALREDVAALLAAFEALESPWRGAASKEILDLPGLGVCVPDLVFSHAKTRERVFFEALGFWSRDAVWKRVELARGGLSTAILFAVSSRLRVSEAVLEEDDTAALYVYKGTMSARAVERKLDLLAKSGRRRVTR